MTWLDSLEDVRKRDWSAAPRPEQDATAREVVDICSYGGCLASVVPIPLVDLAILLPVHSAMVMTVGHVYARSITQTEAKRIAMELGAVAGMSFAGVAAIGALKRLLLPGVGGLLSIPANFALTWGLGRAAIAYFSEPSLSREDLKRVFEDALREGRNVFSPEALERFRQRAMGEAPRPSEPPRATPPPPRSATETPPAEAPRADPTRPDPPRAEPSTSAPSAAPASAAPASTAPASTAPASAAPASTAPASTAPASTAPASAAPPPSSRPKRTL